MNDARQEGTHHRKPNRLAKEKSPYLLQHAYNPVDWYPWGEEAFEAAKERDVPIFLSIGYSTCHWCHVMERESFENDEVADYLNRNFVAIKVDREERPDVDAIYMTAVQAMTGSGGWPLSVWLTHDLKPFYGGTYFPPDDRFGRPGFLGILERIHTAWATQRDKVLASGTQLADAIKESAAAASPAEPGTATLDKGLAIYRESYDAVNGGFGSAPKFPRAHELSFLLRRQRRDGDARTLAMVTHTLDAMAAGGIHDQIGGGFHRYSTDATWLVPHFEKMLYDQAILARAYLEAWQVTGEERYAQVVHDIFTYVLRDLRDPGGAFRSAEDADSEGEEGRFYVWKPAEIAAALGEEKARVFGAFYGVTAAGNFENGASILHAARSEEEVAKELKLSVPDLEKILADGRKKLLEVRSRRVRPHLDDKVLTDWNGLIISSLASAGAALHEPAWTDAAAEAADFIVGRLERKGRLLHRYRDGDASIPGFLDDYAFFGQGLFDLYEATFDARWLAESGRLANEAVRLFRDDHDGAFRMVGGDGEKLLIQSKEIYDGAIPSGNSVAAAWLLRLGDLTGDAKLQEAGRGILRAFGGRVEKYPAGYPYYLMALELAAEPTREIVVAGSSGSAETQRMIDTIRAKFLPDSVVAWNATGAEGEAARKLIPFLHNQVPQEGKATAYVCRNYACDRPTTDPKRLAELLDGPPAAKTPSQ
ncbi:MAG TPA: thioredoxin domain-containing protein [Candidatus Saccharimonadales bacterium]|nr:thioredoxin domain-containing protein [Candidatus Saccharimonadales bacterium]